MATILFIGQSTKQFSYYETSIRELVVRGHIVVLRYDIVFSRGTIYPALQNFLIESNATKFKWMSKAGLFARYISYFSRELRSYSWYLSRSDQSQYYTDRWADLFPGIMPNILKIEWVKRIIRHSTCLKLLETLERLMPAPCAVIKDIKAVLPDLVYVSPGNLRYSNEIAYVKAASKLGIPSVISVLSWDNLTNKGLFHWTPDIFLTWNRHHEEELKTLHAIDNERIKMVGAQLFDKWAQRDESFLPDEGLLEYTKDPYMLYLGSSSNIAKDESKVLKNITSQVLQKGHSCRIIFKPHPAHYEYYQKLSIDYVILLPKQFGLSETLQDIANFHHLVMSARCVIGINTSGFLDSVLIGKRTFAYLSAEHEQTQRLSAHYRLLTDYKVIIETNSYEQMVDLTDNDSAFIKNRNLFLASFVRPHGEANLAGFHAADVIESIINR